MNPHKGYMFPFACFHCRRSFKRSYEPNVGDRPCPHCGGLAVRLDRKFKAPPTDDCRQWAKVEYLVAHGFRFESVYNPDGTLVAYPDTLKEAEEFVKRHGRPVGPFTDA
jgi:hypothetical protein